ncbi:MAG: mannose-6-phosphate isomerase, class I [Treponema sp.]|jgi:mannose-6-phosphate isomerase|nr:mannose-6-phosphate isomerase, class I [Treponema sp.]
MNRLLKLHTTIKKYAWGSPAWIPRLVGAANPAGEPWAELWMGTHPEGPSQAELDGALPFLGHLIQQNPRFYLGPHGAEAFETLPFLLKCIAPAQPLSIQAHPDLRQARLGWERENQAGIPPGSANRNYRDPNHKPELLCALAPFRALCGFRSLAAVREILDRFSRPGTEGLPKPLAVALSGLTAAPTLRDFFAALEEFPEETRSLLCAYTRQHGPELAKRHPAFAAEWRTAAYLAGLYPKDPAAIAPFYLHLLNLAPGEALFLPPGVLHAYLEGFGVEVMANSDNVLRGGLTAKQVDIQELLKIVNFTPFLPKILKAETPEGGSFARFPSVCREFSLGVLENQGGTAPLHLTGPAIVLLIQGRVILSQGTERLALVKGESAFIAPGEKAEEVRCSGSYTLYIAETGLTAP